MGTVPVGKLLGHMVKNPPAKEEEARDAGSIPGWSRSPGVGNGTPVL